MFRAASRPTGRWFRNHLLHVLGLLTESEPFVGIDPEQIILKTLDLAGIDPDNPPWEVKTRADQPKRIIGFTFRNLRPQYTKSFLTMEMDNGTWALSLLGAQKAAELQSTKLPKYKPRPSVTDVVTRAKAPVPKPPEQPKAPAIEVITPRREPKDCNLTAKWVREHGKAVYTKLRQYLAPRFPTSREQQLIEEHIQTFLTVFVARDSLRSRLERGEDVPISQVCVYARNNVNSQIRDNARRPLHRILQGARTKKERDAYVTAEDWTARVHIGSNLHLGGRWSHDDEEWINPLEGLSDDSTEKMLDEKLAFDEGFDSFLTALKRRAPSQAADFAAILEDRFVMEMTVLECAEKRGITRNQAASMLRTARNIVIREYERGTLRRDLGQ